MVALTVILSKKSRGIKRLLSILKSDRINIELKKARGVEIKHITYTTCKGRVNLNKINTLAGQDAGKILCAENIKLPSESGFKRFFSLDFSSRLCTNMALFAVSKCRNPEKLKIGIYDLSGKSADFLCFILRFCSQVIVVTDAVECYKEALAVAMDELGATAVVTVSREALCDCDMVVAPDEICEKLPLREDTLVLTVSAPKENIKGLVYYKYSFKMPNGFDKIKPDELDEEYFCSALYTLGRQHQLGSIIPSLCIGRASSHTLKSLCAYLNHFT